MSDLITKYNTELYHVGVKGMKWGVRKARKQALKAYDRRVKDDWKQAKRDRKAGLITKDSLQYRNARGANVGRFVEKAFLFSPYRADARAKMDSGQNAASAYLEAYGKQALTAVAVSAVATAGLKIASRYIMSRGGQ